LASVMMLGLCRGGVEEEIVVITRMWRGWARSDHADRYRFEVMATLRQVPGFRGASQIQALERTQPPARSGLAGLRGAPTTTSGTARPPCSQRWRWPLPGHRRLPATPPPPRVPGLPQLVAKAYPRRQLHVVLDNCATHKHQRVQAWLGRHLHIQLHFTPTDASWLTWSRCSSRSSSGRRCAAATSPAWRRWSRPSAASAMAGTNAASHLAGPKTPTRSSPSST
jgi:hypothetical protein